MHARARRLGRAIALEGLALVASLLAVPLGVGLYLALAWMTSGTTEDAVVDPAIARPDSDRSCARRGRRDQPAGPAGHADPHLRRAPLRVKPTSPLGFVLEQRNDGVRPVGDVVERLLIADRPEPCGQDIQFLPGECAPSVVVGGGLRPAGIGFGPSSTAANRATVLVLPTTSASCSMSSSTRS